MRSNLLALVCLILLATGAARADEGSHRKAVMELFEQTEMAKVLNASMETSLKLQIQSNPAIARFEPQLRAFFAKHMSWESLKEDFTVLYMKTFSEAELKELVAFYKTPVGKKALRELPLLMQRGGELGMARVHAHMGELQAILQEPATTRQEAGSAPKPAGAKKPSK